MEDLGADLLSPDDTLVRETVQSLLTGMTKSYDSDEYMEEGGDDYVITMASDNEDEEMSVQISRVPDLTLSPHPSTQYSSIPLPLVENTILIFP